MTTDQKVSGLNPDRVTWLSNTYEEFASFFPSIVGTIVGTL